MVHLPGHATYHHFWHEPHTSPNCQTRVDLQALIKVLRFPLLKGATFERLTQEKEYPRILERSRLLCVTEKGSSPHLGTDEFKRKLPDGVLASEAISS